ncbi:hypothetical protein KIN20_034338 [Parelaphostrongylus tenuis]|uniref:Uncharacterized protein n=1 Tax=Parelaphostrongylus tenuis TaxID=148309 RepID=A0AAD5RA31_PARTN|nr:hypothetical protein KIN20_006249 [Parelaphostrongylus tenuis]KAJ1372240.1 hypothetical protein KIN20_034338 [Parelaphostrongylus tenuis]
MAEAAEAQESISKAYRSFTNYETRTNTLKRQNETIPVFRKPKKNIVAGYGSHLAARCMRELVMYLQRDMVPDSAVVPSFRSSPFSSRYKVQSPVGIDVSDQEEVIKLSSTKIF